MKRKFLFALSLLLGYNTIFGQTSKEKAEQLAAEFSKTKNKEKDGVNSQESGVRSQESKVSQMVVDKYLKFRNKR